MKEFIAWLKSIHFLHDWSKWTDKADSAVGDETRTVAHIYVQERTCFGCGKRQMRHIRVGLHGVHND